MSHFREFEIQVLRMLVAPKLGTPVVEALLREADFISYEYSGCGYFLTVKHHLLPKNRIVCDDPWILGNVGNIQSGFLVFIENGELMLECHAWSDTDVPENFRECNVLIAAASQETPTK